MIRLHGVLLFILICGISLIIDNISVQSQILSSQKGDAISSNNKGKRNLYQELEACEIKLESSLKESKELRDLGKALHRKLTGAEASLKEAKELNQNYKNLLDAQTASSSNQGLENTISELKETIKILRASNGEANQMNVKSNSGSDNNNSELLSQIQSLKQELEKEKSRCNELEMEKNHAIEMLSSSEAKIEWTKKEFDTETKKLQELLSAAERSIEGSRSQSEKSVEDLKQSQERLKSAEERANLLEEENNEIKSRTNYLESQEKAHLNEERRLRILFLKYKNLAEDPALFDIALKKAEWLQHPTIGVGLESAINKTYSMFVPKIQSTEESLEEFQEAIKRTSDNLLAKVGHQEFSPMLSGMLVYGILLVPFIFSVCLLVRIKKIFSMTRLLMWMSLYNSLFCLVMYLTSIWADQEAVSALKDKDPELMEFVMITLGAYYFLFLVISIVFFAKRLTCDTKCALLPSDLIRVFVPIIIGIHFYDKVWQYTFTSSAVDSEDEDDSQMQEIQSDGNDAQEIASQSSNYLAKFPYTTWAQYSLAFFIVFIMIIFSESSQKTQTKQTKLKGGDKSSDTSSLPDQGDVDEAVVISSENSASLRNRRNPGGDKNVVITINEPSISSKDDVEAIPNENEDEQENGEEEQNNKDEVDGEEEKDATVDELNNDANEHDDLEQVEDNEIPHEEEYDMADENNDWKDSKQRKKEKKKKKDSKKSKKSQYQDEIVVEADEEEEIEFIAPETIKEDIMKTFTSENDDEDNYHNQDEYDQGDDNEVDDDIEEGKSRKSKSKKSDKKSKKKSKSKHSSEKID